MKLLGFLTPSELLDCFGESVKGFMPCLEDAWLARPRKELGDKVASWKRTLLTPLWAESFPTCHPGLPPWAVFWRRFAAGNYDSLATRGSEFEFSHRFSRANDPRLGT